MKLGPLSKLENKNTTVEEIMTMTSFLQIITPLLFLQSAATSEQFRN